MRIGLGCGVVTLAAALLVAGHTGVAQGQGGRERFTAVAIANNNLATGVGTVIMEVSRWSSDQETATLAETLQTKGPNALLSALQQARPTGTIRTPDSIAYDLRFAHQTKGEDGGRRIVLATDRPVGFWEARSGSRTLDYPFTVVQMQIGNDGSGTGTLSVATAVRAAGKVIELENFASAPIMLTKIQAEPAGK